MSCPVEEVGRRWWCPQETAGQEQVSTWGKGGLEAGQCGCSGAERRPSQDPQWGICRLSRLDITSQSHPQGERAGQDLRTMKETLQKRLETLRETKHESGGRIKSKEKTFQGAVAQM